MPLNIYIISHPIFKLLTNSINLNTNNKQEYLHNYKYIGFILIYEIIRKYIKIKKIYIKCINYIKEIYIIDSDQQYYLFTNLAHNYQMIGDITILIPNITIINVEDNITELFKNQTNNIDNKAHIIILDIIMNTYSIIELIKYLEVETNISLNNIHIGCIECYNHILEKLGEQYRNIDIYTNKII